MNSFVSNPYLVGFTAVIVSAVLTVLVRGFARKYGHVAKPKSDRWHKRPTAMLGGAAIFLATVLLYAAFVPLSLQTMVIIGASTFLFLVGLIDDILNIKPYQKLVGQLIGASIVIGFGLRIRVGCRIERFAFIHNRPYWVDWYPTTVCSREEFGPEDWRSVYGIWRPFSCNKYK